MQECIAHELAHLLADPDGYYSTDPSYTQAKIMFESNIFKTIEIDIDMLALEMLIPRRSFIDNLFKYEYDFEKIADVYNVTLETILQASIFYDHLCPHYIKAKVTNIGEVEIVDYYIGHNQAVVLFNVDDAKMSIFNNSDSQASKCWKEERSCRGETLIGSDFYYCFAFYDNYYYSNGLRDYVNIYVYGWPRQMYHQGIFANIERMKTIKN